MKLSRDKIVHLSHLVLNHLNHDEEVEFFERKIRPLLVENCHACHAAATKRKGGLLLDSREAILKGGDSGRAVVPGDPEKSLVLSVVRYGDEIKMPPKGKLADDQIAALAEWVKRGAPWPAGAKSAMGAAATEFNLRERAKHWSLRPVQSPRPPSVKQSALA